jgi:hypothetical protein
MSTFAISKWKTAKMLKRVEHLPPISREKPKGAQNEHLRGFLREFPKVLNSMVLSTLASVDKTEHRP